MVTTAVDAMGGDHAPDAIVQGAAEASTATESTIVLVGDRDRIRAVFDRVPHRPSNIEIVHAPRAIPMDANRVRPSTSSPTPRCLRLRAWWPVRADRMRW